MKTVVFISLALLLPARLVVAQEGEVIASMDEMRFSPPKEKGSASLVSGKVGKAVRFRFEADAPSTFFTSNIHGRPEWDRADGFSFWVRGEGTEGFGGLEFIYDDDYAVRYDLCFPVKTGEWTKITVAWRDLVAVLPGPRTKSLGSSSGNLPSKLSALFIGKWWYWADYPALCFDIDEIRLEPRIEAHERNDIPQGPPLARVAGEVEGRKTDHRGDDGRLADRQAALGQPRGLLGRPAAGRIESKFNSEVTIINPAIGGTQLRQNVILIPRWLARVPEPDLVTIFFGGNDWDSGMRGDEFRRTCRRRGPGSAGDPWQGRCSDHDHEPLGGAMGCDRGAGRGLPDCRP